MRHLACLAIIMVASCDSNRSAPKPEGKPTGSQSQAADPPKLPGGSAGSAEVPPKWASDPPAVLRDKITGVNAHIVIVKSSADFAEYRDVLKLVGRMPGVVAAEAFIFVELAIAKAGQEPVSVAIKGVDPAQVGRVLTFATKMKTGALESLAKGTPPPIILGDVLAKSLGVRVGDDVTISRPKEVEDMPPDLYMAPEIKPTLFRVSGTFHTDFDEYDGRLALAPLAAVQAMLERGDQVLGVEMTVEDLATSDQLAAKIETALGGPPYKAIDWYELNKQLFTSLFGARRP